jgi:hypothetical protein
VNRIAQDGQSSLTKTRFHTARGRMTNMSKKFLFAAVTAIAVLAPAGANADIVASPACRLGGMKAITSTDGVGTTSNLYRRVPAMRIPFVQGTRSSCVLVRFSAEAGTDGTSILIRAVIDGETFIATPTDITFTFSTGGTQARSFEFLFANVPAGSHVAEIQWQSNNSGVQSNIGNRTLVVEYSL